MITLIMMSSSTELTDMTMVRMVLGYSWRHNLVWLAKEGYNDALTSLDH